MRITTKRSWCLALDYETHHLTFHPCQQLLDSGETAGGAMCRVGDGGRSVLEGVEEGGDGRAGLRPETSPVQLPALARNTVSPATVL